MPQSCSELNLAFSALHRVADPTVSWGTLVMSEEGAQLPQELGFTPQAALPNPGWSTLLALSADNCGVLWLIDAHGRLWRYDYHTQRAESPPCQSPLLNARGLVVTATAVVISHGAVTVGVTALARSTGQILWHWPAATRDLGDIVTGAAQSAWVLDRAGRLIQLDAQRGALLADLPTPGLARRLARGLDNKFYLLGDDTVWRADDPAATWTALPLAPLALATPPRALTADHDGMILLGMDLHPAEPTPLIHRLAPDGSAGTPLVGYLGTALHLTWGRARRLFIVAADNAVIPLLPHARYMRAGAFEIPLFDAGRAGVRWHKIMLDITLPAGAKVRLLYRAADSVSDLSATPWSAPVENFTDTLITAMGRYLQVQGELSTTHPLATPVLRRVTAVLPRRSYLRFLPAVYQSDPAGVEFLERYLSLFETLNERLDTLIAGTPALADPYAVPRDFLSWLADWLALGLDEGWTQEQQRRFIAAATSLYRARGTRAGLLQAIALLTARAPLVFESFQLDAAIDPHVRADYARVFGDAACHYCVMLQPDVAQQPGLMRLLERVIEDYTPAHVMAGVTGLRPWLRLGAPTFLGINTQLTRQHLTLENAVLGGGETALIDHDEGGQVERKSRLGQDAVLQ